MHVFLSEIWSKIPTTLNPRHYIIKTFISKCYDEYMKQAWVLLLTTCITYSSDPFTSEVKGSVPLIMNYTSEDCTYSIRRSANFTISAYITYHFISVTASCKVSIIISISYYNYYDAVFLRLKLLYSNIMIQSCIQSNHVLRKNFIQKYIGLV